MENEFPFHGKKIEHNSVATHIRGITWNRDGRSWLKRLAYPSLRFIEKGDRVYILANNSKLFPTCYVAADWFERESQLGTIITLTECAERKKKLEIELRIYQEMFNEVDD